MNIGDKIRELRESQNMTQSDLADRLNISHRTVSTWETGVRLPRMGYIEDLCQIFGISKSELLGDVGRSSFRPVPNVRLIPVLGRIACGSPILAEQNIDRMMAVPDKIECNYILECRGDSMKDVGIDDGDLVYVRSQPDVSDGEIAVVMVENEATLKRVYHHRNMIQLVSANAKYPPMILTERDGTVRIEGKVVAFTHII